MAGYRLSATKLLMKLAENFRVQGKKYLKYGRDNEDIEFLGIGKGYYGSAEAIDRLLDRIGRGLPVQDEEEEEEEESEAICLQQ